MSMQMPHTQASPEGNGNGNGAAGGQQAVGRPFRPQFSSSPQAQSGAQPRSRSQDPAVARVPYNNLGVGEGHAGHPGPSTVSAVRSAESETGETPDQADVIERLKDMEDRQKNIEALLGEILKSLEGGGSSKDPSGEDGDGEEGTEGGNGAASGDATGGGEVEAS